MSHTNKTVNYELPQYVDTDRPSWRGDVNETNVKIDAAIKQISDSSVSIENVTAIVNSVIDSMQVITIGGLGLTAKQLDEMTIY